jgi:hypothetical protein
MSNGNILVWQGIKCHRTKMLNAGILISLTAHILGGRLLFLSCGCDRCAPWYEVNAVQSMDDKLIINMIT